MIIQGFLDISTSDILDVTILVTRPPMHWKMFSGIPGLYPPTLEAVISQRGNQNVSRHSQMFWEGEGETKSPLAENHWLEDTSVVKTCGSVKRDTCLRKEKPRGTDSL